MSTLSQFGGNRATKAVTNGFSAAGAAGVAINTGGLKTVASGALTANTLASVTGFPVTGAGELAALALTCVDTTSRTLRLQVIADGVTVFDSSASAAIVTAGNGIAACGNFVNIGSAFAQTCGGPIRFNSSLDVKACSSLTETAKINTSYALQTF